MPRTRKLARTKIPPEYLGSRDPMRPPQRTFIESLLEQRDVPDGFREQNLLDQFHANKIDQDGASELIDALRALPRVYRGGRAAGRAADLPKVPAGHYCLFGAHGKAQFYRVRHGAGQFDGWTYLDVQTGEEFQPIANISKARRILNDISKDPKRTAERYAHLLQKCFRCGNELTNKVSRHIGCDSVCAGEIDWINEKTIALLQEAERTINKGETP